MVEYEKLYKILFNEITDVIQNLELHNYDYAKEKLINIQQKVEDLYMQSDEQ